MEFTKSTNLGIQLHCLTLLEILKPRSVRKAFLKGDVKLIFTVVVLLFLVSCTSEFESFNEQALIFAKNDARVDEKEFNALLDEVAISDEKGFDQFKDDSGRIDSSKVVSYLYKYYSANDIRISKDDIWRPTPVQKISSSYNVNVFLENSGSVNGYLNDPNTQFKNSVYSLLTRLKLLVDKDSLNLYLINKDNQLIFGNASNNDLEKFKNILNPTSFSSISKGKIGTTNINELIKRCLNKVDDNNLSVFISDCIYSPGKGHPDAAMYLAEQKQGIYLNFATELRDRNSDLAVLILRLEAGFKGIYYDKEDEEIVLNDLIERPFFIWFIGTTHQIRHLQSSKKLDEIDGGVSNKFILKSIKEPKEPRYKILSKPTMGDFSRTKLSSKNIVDATPSKKNQNKGMFGFNVAVDFSGNLQDASYFLDTSNYVLSNSKYKIVVESISDNNEASVEGFTHLIKFQTTDLKDEVLRIDVVGKAPNWTRSYSSIDDSDILFDKDEQKKTFGLEYLVNGVNDAFYPPSSTNRINTISITIKR